MLYIEGLEELIFNRHKLQETDELIILSGYLGPGPVKRLQELPFNSTVIYGMYGSEGIKPSLHNSLINIQEKVNNLNIFYSKLAVHSKCYIWKKRGDIIHALIGSANFSVNGLTTPFREVLGETTLDTFSPLNDYINHILNNSISCLEVEPERIIEERQQFDNCLMSLLGRKGEVEPRSGLNWGQNPINHTTLDDAYVPLRTSHIKKFPNLFPPKQESPIKLEKGRRHRHNDSIEIIWDDGLIMKGLLEGSQTVKGVLYAKQISSFPNKHKLGEYIRKRIGVPLGQPVRRHHLDDYGRTDIEVSLLAEGVYKFDFSV